MHFTTRTETDGVAARDFVVDDVPGTLWTPAAGTGRLPLVLLGHGGGNDKTSPAMVGRARKLVLDGGFAAACVDAPGHGARPLTETDERERALMYAARAAGSPEGPIVERYNADIAARAVPEWRAVIDALQTLPEIGTGGPIGFFGINMGTAVGVPLTAADPRITAAVFGQFWPGTLTGYAGRITVPIEFALQWDDEHIDRRDGLALFDAFASTEKTLHANAGRHKDLPRFESDSAVRFFTRHLQPAT